MSKRIYALDDDTGTVGFYLALDKSGETEAVKKLISEFLQLDLTTEQELSSNLAVDAQAYSKSHGMAYSATITYNANNGNSQYTNPITGPLTATVSNIKDGSTMLIKIVQDGTGSRAITLDSSFGTKSNESADLSTTADDVNLIFVTNSEGDIFYSILTFTP